MTSTPDLPIVPDIELPIAELTAPLSAPDRKASDSASWADQPDIRGLCELLEPAISASIARKARQRRYTP